MVIQGHGLARVSSPLGRVTGTSGGIRQTPNPERGLEDERLCAMGGKPSGQSACLHVLMPASKEASKQEKIKICEFRPLPGALSIRRKPRIHQPVFPFCAMRTQCSLRLPLSYFHLASPNSLGGAKRRAGGSPLSFCPRERARKREGQREPPCPHAVQASKQAREIGLVPWFQCSPVAIRRHMPGERERELTSGAPQRPAQGWRGR